MKRVLSSLIGLGLLGLMLTIPTKAASVTLQGGEKQIFATLEPDCDPGQIETLWTWTITGFDVYDPALAPDFITVEWTTGDEIVPHRGFTGTGFAKYSTDSHGTDISPYIGASAFIFEEWEGIFRISHPVCPLEDTPTPTQPSPPETETPTNTPTSTPTGSSVITDTPTPTSTLGLNTPTFTPSTTTSITVTVTPTGTGTVIVEDPSDPNTPTPVPQLPSTGEFPLDPYVRLEWLFVLALVVILGVLLYTNIKRTKSDQ
jgi:hypothetical protein